MGFTAEGNWIALRCRAECWDILCANIIAGSSNELIEVEFND